MRQSHLILFNASVMWVSRVLLLVPQLILVPYLIGTIGEVGYGVYALVWSLMMSIEQSQESLQSGVIKYSAGFFAKEQIEDINRLVSSSFVFSLLLAALACTGAVISAAFYNDDGSGMATALVVVGIMVLFIFPLTPYVAVINSRQCFYVGAIAATASKYIGLLVIVSWFSLVGPSLEAMIIIMAAMLILSRLAQVPVAYSLVPGLRIHPGLFNRKSFGLIMAFGTFTVLGAICIAVNSTGIRWLMGSLASASFVTHLVIMLMPGLLLSQIVVAATITVMPAASAYEAAGNHKMLRELLIRGTRYIVIAVSAGILVAVLLMKNALTLWLGAEYEFLAPYALVLFVSIAIQLSTSTSHHMLKGMGKLKTVVLIYFFALVVVPVSLILIAYSIWNDPYLAVIVGLATGNAVCGGLQIWFATKAVGANLMNVLIRAYAQPLIVLFSAYGVLLVLTGFTGIDGLLGGIFVSLLISLLYITGCYVLIFTTAERRQVIELLQIVREKAGIKVRFPLTKK